jgi:hypothetical protein
MRTLFRLIQTNPAINPWSSSGTTSDWRNVDQETGGKDSIVTKMVGESTQSMPELSDYELHYLVSHLTSAGLSGEIDSLLSANSFDGSHFWYVEKESRGDRHGYANDLSEAFAVASKNLISPDAHPSDATAGSIVRYCMGLSTVNEFAASLPGGLLRELIHRQLWNAKAVLEYAKRKPSPDRRIASLSAVLPFLTDAMQNECYELAYQALLNLESISSVKGTLVILQSEALSRLAGALTRSGRYDLLIRMCTECHTWPTHQEFFGQVAQLLLAVPKDISHNVARCAELWFVSGNTLLEGMPFIPLLNDADSSGSARVLFEALKSEEFNKLRLLEVVQVLMVIRPYLSPSDFHALVRKTYERAKTNSGRHIWTLVEMMPFLNASQQEEVLCAVLPVIESAGWAEYDLRRLVSRFSQTATSHRDALLKAIGRIATPYGRSVQMAAALELYTPAEREQVVNEIFDLISALRAGGDNWSTEELLYAFSQASAHLTPEQVRKLLEQVRAITDHKTRVRSLACILPSTASGSTDELLRTELAKVKEIDDPDVFDRFCETAAAAASTDLLKSIPRLLQTPQDKGWFLVGLGRLMPYLQDSTHKAEICKWILDAARNVPEERLCWCLLDIAPYLDESERRLAYRTAMSVSSLPRRFQCCAALALSSKELLLNLRDLLCSELKTGGDPKERADAYVKALNICTSMATSDLIEHTVTLISRVEYPTHRAQVLATVGTWGSQRADRMKSDLLEEMFGPVREAVARDVLRALSSTLTADMVRGILNRLAYSSDDDLRLEAIPAILARCMQLGNQEQAFMLAVRQKKRDLKDEALVAIAPYVNGQLIHEAGAACLAIENTYYRDRGVSRICVRACELGIWADFQHYPARISEPLQRVPALCGLAVCANEKQAFLSEALKSFECINQRMRGNVIEVLVDALVKGPARSELATNFVNLVKILTNESREELIPHVYALAPALHVLGGVNTVENALEAIRDIARWWP